MCDENNEENKEKMTACIIFVLKKVGLTGDSKSWWEQTMTKLAASKHLTTKVSILYGNNLFKVLNGTLKIHSTESEKWQKQCKELSEKLIRL